jgi:hypothetical protein
MKGLELTGIATNHTETLTWSADLVGAPTALVNHSGVRPQPFVPDRIRIVQQLIAGGDDPVSDSVVITIAGRNILKSGQPGQLRCTAIYVTDRWRNNMITMPGWLPPVVRELKATPVPATTTFTMEVSE